VLLTFVFGTNDNRFRFVWVQAETVGVKPAMNRLKAVVNGGEGAVSAEGDV